MVFGNALAPIFRRDILNANISRQWKCGFFFSKIGLVDNQVKCDCGSLNIIKHGKRKTKQGFKQRYLCKNCGKTFVIDQIKGHKANGELIALTMDLYFKGLSLRKLADTIYQFYGLKLHHETIRRWIRNFMGKMNEYVNKLEPKVSDVWHADEQQVKSKRDSWLWSWNAIDHEARFLLATTITKNRSSDEAREVFKKAKKTAKGKPRLNYN
jgi:transposase-like protein